MSDTASVATTSASGWNRGDTAGSFGNDGGLAAAAAVATSQPGLGSKVGAGRSRELTYGSTIVLLCQDTDKTGFLSSEGFLMGGVFVGSLTSDTAVPPNVTECLFQVYPRLETLQKVSAGPLKRHGSTTSLPTEGVVDEEKIILEQNQTKLAGLLGESVRYGDVLWLRHVLSGRFVTLQAKTGGTAGSGGMAKAILTESEHGESGCDLRVVAAGKGRVKGDIVMSMDRMAFQTVAYRLKFLSPAQTTIPLNMTSIPISDYIDDAFEVECGNRTTWRVIVCGEEERRQRGRQSKKMAAGDVIVLRHAASGGYLMVKADSDDIIGTVFKGVEGSGPTDTGAASGGRDRVTWPASAMWILESEDMDDCRRAVPYSNTRFRLANLSTGLYLSSETASALLSAQDKTRMGSTENSAIDAEQKDPDYRQDSFILPVRDATSEVSSLSGSQTDGEESRGHTLVMTRHYAAEECLWRFVPVHGGRRAGGVMTDRADIQLFSDSSNAWLMAIEPPSDDADGVSKGIRTESQSLRLSGCSENITRKEGGFVVQRVHAPVLPITIGIAKHMGFLARFLQEYDTVVSEGLMDGNYNVPMDPLGQAGQGYIAVYGDSGAGGRAGNQSGPNHPALEKMCELWGASVARSLGWMESELARAAASKSEPGTIGLTQAQELMWSQEACETAVALLDVVEPLLPAQNWGHNLARSAFTFLIALCKSNAKVQTVLGNYLEVLSRHTTARSLPAIDLMTEVFRDNGSLLSAITHTDILEFVEPIRRTKDPRHIKFLSTLCRTGRMPFISNQNAILSLFLGEGPAAATPLILSEELTPDGDLVLDDQGGRWGRVNLRGLAGRGSASVDRLAVQMDVDGMTDDECAAAYHTECVYLYANVCLGQNMRSISCLRGCKYIHSGFNDIVTFISSSKLPATTRAAYCVLLEQLYVNREYHAFIEPISYSRLWPPAVRAISLENADADINSSDADLPGPEAYGRLRGVVRNYFDKEHSFREYGPARALLAERMVALVDRMVRFGMFGLGWSVADDAVDDHTEMMVAPLVGVLGDDGREKVSGDHEIEKLRTESSRNLATNPVRDEENVERIAGVKLLVCNLLHTIVLRRNSRGIDLVVRAFEKVYSRDLELFEDVRTHAPVDLEGSDHAMYGAREDLVVASGGFAAAHMPRSAHAATDKKGKDKRNSTTLATIHPEPIQEGSSQGMAAGRAGGGPSRPMWTNSDIDAMKQVLKEHSALTWSVGGGHGMGEMIESLVRVISTDSLSLNAAGLSLLFRIKLEKAVLLRELASVEILVLEKIVRAYNQADRIIRDIAAASNVLAQGRSLETGEALVSLIETTLEFFSVSSNGGANFQNVLRNLGVHKCITGMLHTLRHLFADIEAERAGHPYDDSDVRNLNQFALQSIHPSRGITEEDDRSVPESRSHSAADAQSDGGHSSASHENDEKNRSVEISPSRRPPAALPTLSRSPAVRANSGGPNRDQLVNILQRVRARAVDFICQFCQGNDVNQGVIHTSISVFVEYPGMEPVDLCRIYEAVLGGNAGLCEKVNKDLALLPFRFIRSRGQNAAFLRLLSSIVIVEEKGVTANQAIVFRELSKKEADVMVTGGCRVGDSLLSRREWIVHSTPARLDARLEYHLALVNLIVSCSVGNDQVTLEMARDMISFRTIRKVFAQCFEAFTVLSDSKNAKRSKERVNPLTAMSPDLDVMRLILKEYSRAYAVLYLCTSRDPMNEAPPPEFWWGKTDAVENDQQHIGMQRSPLARRGSSIGLVTAASAASTASGRRGTNPGLAKIKAAYKPAEDSGDGPRGNALWASVRNAVQKPQHVKNPYSSSMLSMLRVVTQLKPMQVSSIPNLTAQSRAKSVMSLVIKELHHFQRRCSHDATASPVSSLGPSLLIGAHADLVFTGLLPMARGFFLMHYTYGNTGGGAGGRSGIEDDRALSRDMLDILGHLMKCVHPVLTFARKEYLCSLAEVMRERHVRSALTSPELIEKTRQLQNETRPAAVPYHVFIRTRCWPTFLDDFCHGLGGIPSRKRLIGEGFRMLALFFADPARAKELRSIVRLLHHPAADLPPPVQLQSLRILTAVVYLDQADDVSPERGKEQWRLFIESLPVDRFPDRYAEKQEQLLDYSCDLACLRKMNSTNSDIRFAALTLLRSLVHGPSKKVRQKVLECLQSHEGDHFFTDSKQELADFTSQFAVFLEGTPDFGRELPDAIASMVQYTYGLVSTIRDICTVGNHARNCFLDVEGQDGGRHCDIISELLSAVNTVVPSAKLFRSNPPLMRLAAALLNALGELARGRLDAAKALMVSSPLLDTLTYVLERIGYSGDDGDLLVADVRMASVEILNSLTDGNRDKDIIGSILNKLRWDVIQDAISGSFLLMRPHKQRGARTAGGERGKDTALSDLSRQATSTKVVRETLIKESRQLYILIRSVILYETSGFNVSSREPCSVSHCSISRRAGQYCLKHSMEVDPALVQDPAIEHHKRWTFKVEVVRDDTVEAIFFPVPYRFASVISDRKFELQMRQAIYDVPRENPFEKTRLFLDRIRELVFEFHLRSWLLNRHYTAWLIRYYNMLVNVPFIIALVIGIITILFYEGFDVTPAVGYAHISVYFVVVILGLIHLTHSVGLTIAFVVTKLPVFVNHRIHQYLHRHRAMRDRHAGRRDKGKDEVRVGCCRRTMMVLSNSLLYYYTIFLLFSLLGTFWSPYFFAFHLLDIFRYRTVQQLLQSLFLNFDRLFQVGLLFLIFVYIFTILGFSLLPDMHPSNRCETTFNCFLHYISTWVDPGSTFNLFVALPDHFWDQDNSGAFQAAFTSLFTIVVVIFFVGLYQGLIIDAFSKQRDDIMAAETDLRRYCFICSHERFTIEKTGVSFQEHTSADHDPWSYLLYLVYLENQDVELDSDQDAYVRAKLRDNDITFMPIQRAICLETAGGGPAGNPAGAAMLSLGERMTALEARFEDIFSFLSAGVVPQEQQLPQRRSLMSRSHVSSEVEEEKPPRLKARGPSAAILPGVSLATDHNSVASSGDVHSEAPTHSSRSKRRMSNSSMGPSLNRHGSTVNFRPRQSPPASLSDTTEPIQHPPPRASTPPEPPSDLAGAPRPLVGSLRGISRDSTDGRGERGRVSPAPDLLVRDFDAPSGRLTTALELVKGSATERSPGNAVDTGASAPAPIGESQRARMNDSVERVSQILFTNDTTGQERGGNDSQPNT